MRRQERAIRIFPHGQSTEPNEGLLIEQDEAWSTGSAYSDPRAYLQRKQGQPGIGGREVAAAAVAASWAGGYIPVIDIFLTVQTAGLAEEYREIPLAARDRTRNVGVRMNLRRFVLWPRLFLTGHTVQHLRALSRSQWLTQDQVAAVQQQKIAAI